jgi:adenylosuccinate synthase
VLLPYHRLLDRVSESEAEQKIGTTGRGIGPAYQEKAGRRGVRVSDLSHPQRLKEFVDASLMRAERLAGGSIEGERAELLIALDQAFAAMERLPDLAVDVGLEISRGLKAGKRVLLEGAQGTALDLDHGTYPFVTSSNTTAAAAATGVGVGPTAIDSVIGVVKAYTTRVGNGPLPSGFDQEMDEHMRALGGEFGATTGRPRRCGWFDAVLARYAARVNGLTGLAVTKLDVLDTLSEIEIAVAYRTPQGVVDEFPADTWMLSEIEPIYEKMPGWEASTGGARSLSDLPTKAREYLDRIEELSEAPVQMVSVGTRRSQIIHA